jgi:anti-sigma regulatory factor (Ser/Thr protein kinase)
VTPHRFEETRPATADCVPALRTAVAEFLDAAGALESMVQTVKLAVSEALTNVVLHAYPDDDPGPVVVTALVDGDVVEVTITDEGRGMVPRADSPGVGLGLPIIAQLAAAVEISHGAGDGTRLRMSFEAAG